MAVNVCVSGLIHSPQSHIIKSVMLGLVFVDFSVYDVACRLFIGCDDGIREEGLKRVPTHMGINGNEKADFLARTADEEGMSPTGSLVNYPPLR
ncbi:hypothetical protein TNCV_2959681 [Trichonephila clavipes]|nr:hypothetical protein TNCV_2959681 [Trichonephila clavipes]